MQRRCGHRDPRYIPVRTWIFIYTGFHLCLHLTGVWRSGSSEVAIAHIKITLTMSEGMHSVAFLRKRRFLIAYSTLRIVRWDPLNRIEFFCPFDGSSASAFGLSLPALRARRAPPRTGA